MRYDNNCAGSRWWRWVGSVGTLMDGMDRMVQAVMGLGGAKAMAGSGNGNGGKRQAARRCWQIIIWIWRWLRLQ